MKQVGLVCVPLLECLRGCFVVQVFLRDVVIIQAAVEAFDHAVGLWGSGLGQAMLNAVVGADPIKDTGGGWLAFAGSTEAVSKRLAIIGENLADRERSLVDQTLEEAAGGGC